MLVIIDVMVPIIITLFMSLEPFLTFTSWFIALLCVSPTHDTVVRAVHAIHITMVSTMVSYLL